MARSSPPEVPRAGHVATYGLETVQFVAPVSLGILVALFGIVAVSGAALVLHSSGVANSTVDSVPAATAQAGAEPEVQSVQSPPFAPTDEAPASDLPEATEPPPSIEAESSTDRPEDRATAATGNEADTDPGEDKGDENPADEASEGPAANRQAMAARFLQPFTLPREGSKREILLIDNVHSDQLEKYQLKCFIAGVANDYEFSESKVTEFGWVELNPDPVQNEIATLILTSRKEAGRIVERKVRITHRLDGQEYRFFEIHLNLRYRSSRKDLSLVIEQMLSSPRFSELNGVIASDPEAYYFDKFDKTYSADLVRWETTVSNGIRNLPGEIQNQQFRRNVLVNQLSSVSGDDIRAINARRALTSKVNALSKTIRDNERKLSVYRTASPFFRDINVWYESAYDDIDYLTQHLQVDFDLEREDASGPPVTLVSTRGGN